ncbi:hypothetical protein V8E36_006314 [Tilletia maclaganii]
MYTVVRLTPLRSSGAPSDFILGPRQPDAHLDQFSLPLSFDVDAQPTLHEHDGRITIACQHGDSDGYLNGVRIDARPRRIHHGDTIRLVCSNHPRTSSVQYDVHMGFFLFNDDGIEEDCWAPSDRVDAAAAIALQLSASFATPLALPVFGPLPQPAPVDTDWESIRKLLQYLRDSSSIPPAPPSRPASPLLTTRASTTEPAPDAYNQASPTAFRYADLVQQQSAREAASTPPTLTLTGSGSSAAASPHPFTSPPTSPSTSVSTSPPQSASTARPPTSPSITPLSLEGSASQFRSSAAAPPATSTFAASPGSIAQHTAPAPSLTTCNLALERMRNAWIEARAAVLAPSKPRSTELHGSSIELTLARVGAALSATRSLLPSNLVRVGPSSSSTPAALRASTLDRTRLGFVRAACQSLTQAVAALSACLPTSIDACNTWPLCPPSTRF